MSAVVIFLDWFGRWLAAMGHHLLRIGFLRPNYITLSDSFATVISFVIVFATAHVFSAWVLTENASLESTLSLAFIRFFGFFVILYAMTARKGRSHALLCVFLGSSAIFEIVQSFIFSFEKSFFMAVLLISGQVFSFLKIREKFLALDATLQTAGYSPLGKKGRSFK